MQISQHIDNLDFSITVYGKAAPSCNCERGASAIDNAFICINRLRDWSISLIEHSDRLSPDDSESTLIIAAIEGGDWAGAVPVKCVLSGSVRIPPSMSVQEVKSGLLNCLYALAAESEHRISRLPTISFDFPVDGPDTAPPASGLNEQTEILPGKVLECCVTDNHETKTN